MGEEDSSINYKEAIKLKETTRRMNKEWKFNNMNQNQTRVKLQLLKPKVE